MRALPRWVRDYLDWIQVPVREPSFSYLGEIAKNQLRRIPFENITKLERWPRRDPLPALEPWLESVRTRGYGGTCFLQNRGLYRLAEALGFDAHMVRLGEHHVAVVARVPEYPDEWVYVDCGSVAPIFEPLRFEKDVVTVATFANERVRLIRSAEDGPFRYERVISGVVVQNEWPFDPARVLDTDTFDAMTYTPPGAFFMKMLRCQIWDLDNSRSKSLVNCVYRVRYADGRGTTTTLESAKDIIDLVATEFGPTVLPTDDAIKVLRELGIDALRPREG